MEYESKGRKLLNLAQCNLGQSVCEEVNWMQVRTEVLEKVLGGILCHSQASRWLCTYVRIPRLSKKHGKSSWFHKYTPTTIHEEVEGMQKEVAKMRTCDP